jgi:uncharacterized protein
LPKKTEPGKDDETGTMGFTELSTTNSKATRSFLEKAFQWRFEEIQMPTGKYLSYRSPNGNMLGIRMTQQSESPTSMNYVRVEDLKKAEARVRDLGGKIILPRTDIPEMGSFFWFKIPSGPMMACWQDAPKR